MFRKLRCGLGGLASLHHRATTSRCCSTVASSVIITRFALKLLRSNAMSVIIEVDSERVSERDQNWWVPPIGPTLTQRSTSQSHDERNETPDGVVELHGRIALLMAGNSFDLSAATSDESISADLCNKHN